METTTEHKISNLGLNLYSKGSEGIGRHSDNMIQGHIKARSTIAILTLGEERTMTFTKKYADPVPQVHVRLPHGSLLLMREDSQDLLEHELKKRQLKGSED